ncbi:MAG TPA: glycine betaine ABC transporter substrate-binding protein [Thermoanaerobaculia bacterium]|nr:glycine betaine ABC transporter substrate-binding protein [Thermoanaerobaculia bacterium]
MRKLLCAALLLAACSRGNSRAPVVVASKNFTESVLLGEIVAQKLESAGCTVDRRLNMGGTMIVDQAITAGSVDVYVEYSGTALTAILKQPSLAGAQAVEEAVRNAYVKRELNWGPPLGFNNTFAMIVRKADATAHGLTKISDLARVQNDFQPGFGYEFVERPDGWNGLLAAYHLAFAKAPKTMDLGLTYKALASNQVDLIAGNSTDGLIESLGLTILQDDRRYFPPYEAAIVYRKDIDEKCRASTRTLMALGYTIDDAAMRRLNFEVDGKKRDVAEVAREFLKTAKRR